MEQIELNTAPRSVVGKQTRALRRTGQVPVSVYGPGVSAMSLQVEVRHLRRVLAQAGSTRLITVKIDDRSYPALAREIQRNPIRGDLIHVDLYAVDINKAINTVAPLVVVGEAEVVRTGQAVLAHAINQIEIQCLPMDLPPNVHVDISGLKEIGDAIHVRDLQALPGVTYVTGADELVGKISPLAAQPTEPAAAAAEGAAPTEVEATKQGKEGEEAEE